MKINWKVNNFDSTQIPDNPHDTKSEKENSSSVELGGKKWAKSMKKSPARAAKEVLKELYDAEDL